MSIHRETFFLSSMHHEVHSIVSLAWKSPNQMGSPKGHTIVRRMQPFSPKAKSSLAGRWLTLLGSLKNERFNIFKGVCALKNFHYLNVALSFGNKRTVPKFRTVTQHSSSRAAGTTESHFQKSNSSLDFFFKHIPISKNPSRPEMMMIYISMFGLCTLYYK